jgi:hypothetical protein
MKCLICNGAMAYYFSKTFDGFGLAKVDYWRCSGCGFALSKTHADMTDREWAALNHEYHSTYQGTDSNPDDPRWVARLESQATVLDDAARTGLLGTQGQWLDYACGDGKLSDLLAGRGRRLLKYDRYMQRRKDYLSEGELRPRRFGLVLTTSVFEHFTRREQFDAVEKLVAEDGVLGLHTMVCERVPADASWFYLLPVHCAFHTNKSMSILFEQWGFRSSVYHVDSRLWFWFRGPDSEIEERVGRANQRQNAPTYLYKKGFVDYWK